MEGFIVLTFCMIFSAQCFSESSILTSISPMDDEFHDMIMKGESKEIIRIVPSVIPNFTTTDNQSSSDSSSISLAKSDANVVTDTTQMTSMNSDDVSESITQLPIVPIINDPVDDDEMATMANISATVISTSDDIQGSLHVSLITSSQNDEDVTSDGESTTSMDSNNASEYFTSQSTVSVTSDPIDNDRMTTTTNNPTTLTTVTDNAQRPSPVPTTVTLMNHNSDDSRDTDPAMNEVEPNPEDSMGSLARLLINSKRKFAAQLEMNSVLPTIRAGINQSINTRKMNSNVHKPTPKPDTSRAIKVMQTWFREVGNFFSRMVTSVRNFFHRH